MGSLCEYSVDGNISDICRVAICIVFSGGTQYDWASRFIKLNTKVIGLCGMLDSTHRTHLICEVISSDMNCKSSRQVRPIMISPLTKGPCLCIAMINELVKVVPCIIWRKSHKVPVFGSKDRPIERDVRYFGNQRSWREVLQRDDSAAKENIANCGTEHT